MSHRDVIIDPGDDLEFEFSPNEHGVVHVTDERGSFTIQWRSPKPFRMSTRIADLRPPRRQGRVERLVRWLVGWGPDR